VPDWIRPHGKFWASIALFVPILLVSLLFYLTSNPSNHPIAFGSFLFMIGIFWIQEYRIARSRRPTERSKYESWRDMQTRTFRSVLIPPTILVFYVWLATFLGENAIYLPLSAQISALNFLLGKVEWLFLYLWMVGFLYVLLGEKLSERRQKLKGQTLADSPLPIQTNQIDFGYLLLFQLSQTNAGH